MGERDEEGEKGKTHRRRNTQERPTLKMMVALSFTTPGNQFSSVLWQRRGENKIGQDYKKPYKIHR